MQFPHTLLCGLLCYLAAEFITWTNFFRFNNFLAQTELNFNEMATGFFLIVQKLPSAGETVWLGLKTVPYSGKMATTARFKTNSDLA